MLVTLRGGDFPNCGGGLWGIGGGVMLHAETNLALLDNLFDVPTVGLLHSFSTL